MGDGEQNEGQVWEGAMFASHNRLDNLIAVIDVNKIQIDGFTKEILDSEPLHDKYESFGWDVIRINGNNVKEILNAFGKAMETKNKPSVIIADTIAGKGVKSLENKVSSHGKWISKDDYENAIRDLK